MPYRIDAQISIPQAMNSLLDLGALDVEVTPDGIAAIIPDHVTPADVACALGISEVAASPAVRRDSGSIWLLNPRAIRIANLIIAPPEIDAPPQALRLIDSGAFGSGHHPTTSLCIEALEDAFCNAAPEKILDVGTGSGILALAALKMGTQFAVGVDIDNIALEIATRNAQLNRLSDRLQLILGGPEIVKGSFPIVVANVLAAPLIEMAPTIVQRIHSHGRLILSGIADTLAAEVRQTYEHLGTRFIHSHQRAGWTLLVFQASW